MDLRLARVFVLSRKADCLAKQVIIQKPYKTDKNQFLKKFPHQLREFFLRDIENRISHLCLCFKTSITSSSFLPFAFKRIK